MSNIDLSQSVPILVRLLDLEQRIEYRFAIQKRSVKHFFEVCRARLLPDRVERRARRRLGDSDHFIVFLKVCTASDRVSTVAIEHRLVNECARRERDVANRRGDRKAQGGAVDVGYFYSRHIVLDDDFELVPSSASVNRVQLVLQCGTLGLKSSPISMCLFRGCAGMLDLFFQLRDCCRTVAAPACCARFATRRAAAGLLAMAPNTVEQAKTSQFFLEDRKCNVP